MTYLQVTGHNQNSTSQVGPPRVMSCFIVGLGKDARKILSFCRIS